MTVTHTTHTTRILSALTAFGDHYVAEHLKAWDPSQLSSNWYEAFKFFISHLYYQGRRDELSKRFCDAMTACLDQEFGNHPRDVFQDLWDNGHIPTHANWSGFKKDTSRLWQAFDNSMGKSRDREMVLDVLRYVHGLANFNVVAHSLSTIDSGNVAEHRTDLLSLRQVGPKTSAFYLRDVVFLFQPRLNVTDLLVLQPIDTWVKRVRALVDPLSLECTSDEEWFVKHADSGYDPGRLNAGAWYLGKHAFQLSLDLLSSKDFSQEELQMLTMRAKE